MSLPYTIPTIAPDLHTAFLRLLHERAEAAVAWGRLGLARKLAEVFEHSTGDYVGPAVIVSDHEWVWAPGPRVPGTSALPGQACCVHESRGLDYVVYPGGVMDVYEVGDLPLACSQETCYDSS